MRIILNADGFGEDDRSVEATIECFVRGALSSATIIVNRPGTAQALDYARRHPEFSFGVHLLLGGRSQGALEREISEQITVVAEQGISVSHVDSMHQLHTQASAVAALRRVLPQFRIKRARSARDTYVTRPGMVVGYWLNPARRRRIRNNFITTDRLYLPVDLADVRAMQDWMPAVTDESLEVGVQPGFDDERANAERQAVQSFSQRAIDAGHHLITWNQL
jgi:predicted glycoside hydrolase/deacetylase ChbG (UPF0249 family)